MKLKLNFDNGQEFGFVAVDKLESSGNTTIITVRQPFEKSLIRFINDNKISVDNNDNLHLIVIYNRDIAKITLFNIKGVIFSVGT